MSRAIARRNLEAHDDPWDATASLPITSLSELVSKLTPCDSSSMRNGPALVTLPLCPNASQPRPGSSRRSGWALASLDEPVVE